MEAVTGSQVTFNTNLQLQTEETGSRHPNSRPDTQKLSRPISARCAYSTITASDRRPSVEGSCSCCLRCSVLDDEVRRVPVEDCASSYVAETVSHPLETEPSDPLRRITAGDGCACCQVSVSAVRSTPPHPAYWRRCWSWRRSWCRGRGRVGLQGLAQSLQGAGGTMRTECVISAYTCES